MAYLLLVVVQLAGLVLIAFGLPGLWLQVASFAAYAWWSGFAAASQIAVGLVAFLALLAEVAEFLLGGRFARRYGGGRRSELGAIAGGVIGAILGFPVPLLGSVFGAMIGAFAGAFLLELTRGRGATPAARAGWGALVGRVVATAMKASVGVLILVIILVMAAR